MAKSRGKLLRGHVSTLTEIKLTFILNESIVRTLSNINLTHIGCLMLQKKENKKASRVYMRIEPKLKQQIQDLAAKNEINFSQLVTGIIVAHLESEKRIYGQSVGTTRSRKAGVGDE